MPPSLVTLPVIVAGCCATARAGSPRTAHAPTRTRRTCFIMTPPALREELVRASDAVGRYVFPERGSAGLGGARASQGETCGCCRRSCAAPAKQTGAVATGYGTAGRSGKCVGVRLRALPG